MAKKYKSGRDVHGLLVLDKPLGLSSNQAVQRVKRLFNAKKVGHTGTLDPLATGVLVLCFGHATKLVDHIMNAQKSYHVVAKLGQQTTTADSEGEVIASSEVTSEQLKNIASVAESFVGDIEQIPPMYSALKKDGVPLYKLARKGKDVIREPRLVTIHANHITKVENDRFAMTVHCSKGTYIRTLVEDIGKELGCYAHVKELRRLSVGCFGKKFPMINMQQLEIVSQTSLDDAILPTEAALLDYPKYEMKNGLVHSLELGVQVKFPKEINHQFIRIYDTDRIFRGLGTRNPQGYIVLNSRI